LTFNFLLSSLILCISVSAKESMINRQCPLPPLHRKTKNIQNWGKQFAAFLPIHGDIA
jgi:hypothetical protein